jgi:glycosyltransferase involved in cell wall biosynthesis
VTRIRVLHVVLDLDAGGLEQLVIDMVRGTDADRFETQVLAVNRVGRLGERLLGLDAVHVAPPQEPWSLLWPSTLARTVACIAPDIVHTHSGIWYKGSLAARLARILYHVHTDHGREYPDPWSNRFIDGLASRRTDVVVAVSEPLRRQLIESVVSYPERVQLVHNGIDTNLFSPVEVNPAVKRKLGLPAEGPIIGSVGRLVHIKGFDLMLEAFAQLRRTWVGVAPPSLVIVGDGPEMSALRSLVQALGLEDGVHLLGWCDSVPDLLPMFDIFTMASRSEGTCLGLLEAMAVGLRPCVTDVGGNRAVLGPGLAHCLIPPNDTEAMALSWRQALDNDDDRVRDGAQARERVVTRYGIRRMIEDYQDIYSSLAG